MARRYVVSLNPEERESLLRLIGVGKGAARKLAHARILLKADEASGQPLQTDEELAATLEVSYDTVPRVRRRFVEELVQLEIVESVSYETVRQTLKKMNK